MVCKHEVELEELKQHRLKELEAFKDQLYKMKEFLTEENYLGVAFSLGSLLQYIDYALHTEEEGEE